MAIVKIQAPPGGTFCPPEAGFAKQQDFPHPASLRARMIRGMVWSLTGAVISRALTLVASIICARLLGRASFGELGIIQSTAGMFGIFAGLGLGLTATKFVGEFREREPAKAGRILALSSILSVVSATATTGVLMALASWLASTVLGAPQLARPLMVGAGLVFFGALNGAQTGALAGFEAFRSIAKVNMAAGLASFPLIALGVWRWQLMGAIWGMVAAMALNCVWNHLALRQQCHRFAIVRDFRLCQTEWRLLYQFSLPAFLASMIVGPAIWACNAFLVRQSNGYAQLGLYAAADRWRLLVLFVPTSIFGMLVPVLSNLYGAGRESSLQRAFRANLWLSFCLALAPALLISALALPIMSLYGVQFSSGWPILVVLACAAVPEAVSNIYMARLICTQRMWWRFALDLQLACALVLLAWWWIPIWGAMGMAAAYTGAMAALCLSQALLGRQQLQSGLEAT